MADISFVVMTWNRGGMRLENLLASLLRHQTRQVREVIVVDTNTDALASADIANTCRHFERARLIHRPMPVFNKPLALNIGIQAASPFSRWIAVTDVDMMFGPGMVRALMDVLTRRPSFVMAEPMRLPQGGNVDPFADFTATCMTATWWGSSMGPGALQAMERGAWFAMHGYDERFVGGLGGMDTDMAERAMTAFGHTLTMPFTVARALHQWHEPSPMKGKLSGLVEKNAPVMANPHGWGDLR